MSDYSWSYPTKTGARIQVEIPLSATTRDLDTVIKYTKLIKKFHKMDKQRLLQKMVDVLARKASL